MSINKIGTIKIPLFPHQGGSIKGGRGSAPLNLPKGPFNKGPIRSHISPLCLRKVLICWAGLRKTTKGFKPGPYFCVWP